MKVDQLTLGDFEIIGLRDGLFLLDGGAMFGVVPKTIWSKTYAADADNRIALSLNSFLIRTKEALVLVETGVGTKLTGRMAELYAVQHDPGLVPTLHRLGYRRTDIDLVINTHLHFDHCGGNTVRREDGTIEPAFPNAQYVIQNGEWATALQPPERDRFSYIRDSFLPLQALGRVRVARGDVVIGPGLEVVLASGHTQHHQCVKVESQDKTFFILGDMVPTSAHVRLSYVMSYDLYPLETMANKKKFLSQGVAGKWIFGFVHDPTHYFGRVVQVENKFEFEPA